MKKLRPILFAAGIVAVAVRGVFADPAPAVDPPASGGLASSQFNPDPGATLKPANANATPFYQPPPGTPPDYQATRDPLLDTPHAPVIELQEQERDWPNREYPSSPQLPPGTMAVPDRWALDIPTFMRYNEPERESPYMYKTPRLWDPYKQSVLKGDAPVLGQDIFLTLTATSFTSYEARDIPTPAGVSTYTANETQFYGAGNQEEVDQFLSFSLDLFQGETVFKPLTWDLHLEPVYNINYTRVQEAGVLSVNPRGSSAQGDNSGVLTNGSGNGGGNSSGIPVGSLPGGAGGLTPGNPGQFLGGGNSFDYIGPEKEGSGYVTRTKDKASLQEAYLEFHLADISPNYDFISMRVGNQPFNSDFRGFVFNDTNLGLRFFGSADSNRYQYNLAAFDMREKDTYSELNTFDARHEYVAIANVYRQDFLVKGYTAQLSFLANFDNGGIHYDRTGNLVDPEPLGGPIASHALHAYYFGLNGDGHIGRLNITNSFYQVIGRDDLNGLAGQAVEINAQMAALELSYDQDWIRFTASGFYASGDNNPENGQGTGFDAIVDNPDFIGGPFSYYVRQGFIFGDTSVDFKQRNSLLLDLRASKDEGQSSFVNPGVIIYGVGTNMDLLPTLRLFLNANYIRMADTAPVNFALHSANVTPQIGWDLSLGVQYRPLLTQNVIVSAGLGALLPGNGYKAIYETNTVSVPGYDTGTPASVDSFLYSGFVAVTLRY